jgi:hypothetical protein
MKFFTALFAVAVLFSCTFDSAGLPDETHPIVCGDGLIDSTEECEPGIIPTGSCPDHGFVTGILSCTDACKISTDSCSNDCNGCITGTVKCQQNTRYTCAEISGDCGQWQIVEACTEPGAQCIVQGEETSCAVNCLSDCHVDSAKKCTGSTIETCSTVTINGEDCLMWNTTSACAPDTCEMHPDTQVVQCVPDCTTGVKKCSDDNSEIIACGKDSEGFTAWVTSLACNILISEQCLLDITNTPYCQGCEGCNPGETRCVSGDLGTEICTGNATCSWWEVNSTCVTGTLCNQVSTTTAQCDSCVECSVGTATCSSPITFTQCTTTTNGCTDYASVQDCPWGYSCTSGVCNDCSTCTIDQSQCVSTNTVVLECQDNGLGCYSMQSADNCETWETCQTNVWEAGDNRCVYTNPGNRCSDPYIVNSLPFNLSNFDFMPLTDNTTFSCNAPIGPNPPFVNPGRDFFMEVYLNQGDTIYFYENGGMDSILRILDSCGPTCLDDKDINATGESMTFSVPSDGYYIFVVENYRGDLAFPAMSVTITE